MSDEYTADDIDVGDVISFRYGPKNYLSYKRVTEVEERYVKVLGGGAVFYRDIERVEEKS